MLQPLLINLDVLPGYLAVQRQFDMALGTVGPVFLHGLLKYGLKRLNLHVQIHFSRRDPFDIQQIVDQVCQSLTVSVGGL